MCLFSWLTIGLWHFTVPSPVNYLCLNRFNENSCWKPRGMAARTILSRWWQRAPTLITKIMYAYCFKHSSYPLHFPCFSLLFHLSFNISFSVLNVPLICAMVWMFCEGIAGRIDGSDYGRCETSRGLCAAADRCRRQQGCKEQCMCRSRHCYHAYFLTVFFHIN